MKLLICIFLVLVILEEYHCDPCLDWIIGSRQKDNDSENTVISVQNEQKHENGLRPSYHPHQPYGLGDRSEPEYPQYGYQPYDRNGLGYRPSYEPFSTYNDRSFSVAYDILYGRQGGASNGTPQTPSYHQIMYRPRYDRPLYGTLYPTPFITPHPFQGNGASNGSPYAEPNSISVTAPVVTGDVTPQRKQFFVTPTGIQETPAQLFDNAS